MPIYPLTFGLTNNAIIKATKNAIAQVDDLNEFLPADIRQECNLILHKKAIQDIHFPKSIADYQMARKRLVFDELFLYNLALSQIRKQEQKKN